MKKTLLFFILLTFLGCAAEDVLDPQIPVVKNDGRTLIVSVSDATTKVNYTHEGEAIKLTWELNDLITIYYNGERVSDFKATEILEGGKLAVFEMEDTDATPLSEGESYTAVYPKTSMSALSNWEMMEIPNTMTQDGSTLEHLKNQCLMRDDFIFSATSNNIYFEHLRPIVIAKMRMPVGGGTPTVFTFTDGEKPYTINLTNAQSVDGIYTLVTPINANSGLRGLEFQLSDGTQASEIKVQTSVDYLPGFYYTADLSVSIDNRNIIFPNQNLKQALLSIPGIDANSDGNISYGEAASVRSLDLSNQNLSSTAPITRSSGSEESNSIDELDYFSNLEDLNISGNGIRNLDEIPCADNLQSLDVSSNKLLLLDVSEVPNLESNGLVCGNQTSDDDSAQNISVITNDTQKGKSLINKSHQNNSFITELTNSVEIPFSNVNLGVSLLYYADLNYDGKVTFEETNSLEHLELGELHGQLTDVDMRYFPNLRSISLSNIAHVTELSTFTKLESIDVGYSDLSLLDISKNTRLTKINTVQCTNFPEFKFQHAVNLKELNLQADYSSEVPELSSIDPTIFPNLETLMIINHKLITEVNTSNNPKLRQLTIENASIQSIDLSNNPNIDLINIQYTDINSIDLSNQSKVDYIALSHNKLLSAIDLSTCPLVEKLYARNCDALTSLDLSNNSKLMEIELNGCSVPSLDISHMNKLWWFLCYNTKVRMTIYATSTQKAKEIVQGYSSNYRIVVK